MGPTFADATAVRLLAPERFAIEIPDGWQQGRGAFGGLVLGTLLRAIEACEEDRTRATRTLSGELCGPVRPGPADVTVRALRRGSHQTNWAAELQQGGEPLATATAILSHARPQPDAPPLDTPPPAADFARAQRIPVGPPVAPVFTQHYDYRSDEADMFTLGDPRALGWIREQAPLERIDAPALIGRLDAWWPCLFALDGQLRPVGTVSFTAELLCDPASLDPRAALRYRARMVALYAGFFVELRELWQGDRVIALNQQTFAILK